jgi:hypothetical protein
VALERLKRRFREKRLPKLADHLDKYIRHEAGKSWYEPPPDTSGWDVTCPEPPSKK